MISRFEEDAGVELFVIEDYSATCCLFLCVGYS